MKFKFGVVLLLAAFLFPAIIRAQVPVGRWEIVHTSGDNSAQTALYPGAFSTFLRADGTGDSYGTFTSSLCVIDTETFNVVPTWVAGVGNSFQITITVNNLGLGPDFSFIYTGIYNPLTPIPGDPLTFIPTISGTYYAATEDVSACNVTTQSNPGSFVAIFLPTISSGSASASLDAFSADNGSAFDSRVGATIFFDIPPAPGQIAGAVSLASNPTFQLRPCFATTSGVVNPLAINSNLSSQTGVSEYMFAEGFDPFGVPTTLFLNGFSANQYTTAVNTDPSAIQITSTDWAVFAAIGEDNPAAGVAGVSNDGINNVIVALYGVKGGTWDGAGGVCTPIHFSSRKSP